LAAPTVDSMTPPEGPPVSGPGSKTPMDSPLAPPTPLGGSPVKPMGAPGAPTKDQGAPLEPLDKDTFDTLVDDIYSAIDDEKIKSENVEDVLNYLLSNSWSEKRIRRLSKYLKSSIKSMIFSIIKHIKEDGVNETIDLIKDKIQEINGEEGIPGGEPVPPPAGGPGGLPLGLPPLGASEDRSNEREITDVDLDIINKRGFNMGKIIVKEGAVVDSAEYAKEIINKISSTARKVKTSMKQFEDVKLKYAGLLALKYAVEGTDTAAGGMGAGMGAGVDAGMPAMDAGPVGPEEASGGVSADLKEDVSEALEKLDDIKDELVEVKELMKEDVGKAEEAIGEGEDVLEKADLGGLESDEADEVEEKAAAAREIVKEAKKKLK